MWSNHGMDMSMEGLAPPAPAGGTPRSSGDGHKAQWLPVARALFARAIGFCDCPPAVVEQLLDAGSIRRFAKGEFVSRTGEKLDRLMLVLAGSVEASLLRRNGHRHLIYFLQTGDFIGIINLVDGIASTNDMISRHADTTLFVVPGEAVRRARAFDPSIGQAFEKLLAFRTRLLHERLAADLSLPLEARLAQLLVMLSRLYGLPRPEGILLKEKISQLDLADWLGVSRQRVNSALKTMKQEGLISQSYSTIMVLDIEALRQRGNL